MRLVAVLCCVLLLTFGWGGNEQIPGPTSPSGWPAWIQNITKYREQTRKSIGYNGSIYSVQRLQWTQTSYIQVQMHPYDRFFYDPVAHQYTVSKFLTDLRTRYGGIDSALVWPTYPNMGIDNRNQYDMIRSMPGHLPGLTQLTTELHQAGVKVLWPYNPWDQGTRPEGVSDPQAVAQLVCGTNGDGFNGDTMESIPDSFYAASVALGKPLALEPEGGGDAPEMNYGTLGWGYWEWKWLDPRRLTNVCDRWAMDRTNDIQSAWFNGDGYESWENVWGTWNGITPRDGEAIRRVGAMLRFFGGLGFLQSQNWEPHTPVLQSAVFASKFPGSWMNETVWTFINKGAGNATGPQITVAVPPSGGMHYFDAYRGVELTPSDDIDSETGAATVTLSFDLEVNGYGCLLATPNATKPGDGSLLGTYLAQMAAMTQHPLEYYDSTWQYLDQQMLPNPATRLYSSAPTGMLPIPRGVFKFQVSGVEIEGGDAWGVDYQYPWEPHPQRAHSHVMSMTPIYMDKFPVTNAQYKAYLAASGYTPLDSWNFLKSWSNGNYPNGWDKKPVTWVSLAEAQAYCSFYGKRLTNEIEWQYAAQGTDGRLYPWGSKKEQSMYPVQQNGRDLPPPADVDAYSPKADSPFGIADLVGNIWQYTTPFQDLHTRTVVLRGSANYRPSGSMWYYPNALELNLHNKYLLFDDAYERAGTLGFRCAVDADPSCASNLCAWPELVPAVVDLTSVGAVDWAHYGPAGAGADRKAGATTTLGPLTSLRGGAIASAVDAAAAFMWSDGTTQCTGNSSAVSRLAGDDQGFRIDAPADSGTRRTLRVYLAATGAKVSVVASLSDASAPAYLGGFTADSPTEMYAYTFDYQASKPGQTLTVKWWLNALCASTLCGAVATPASNVDLTQEGTLDWVHWGLRAPQSVDRLASSPMLIPAFSVIGGGQLAQYSNNPNGYSWSNGAPDASVQGTTTGVYFGNASKGKGFTLTVPSGATARTLRLYVGVWNSRGLLTVTRTGASSPAYTDNSLQNSSGTTNGVYTIRFSAEHPGDSITVAWVQDDGAGNVTLQSATLTNADGTIDAAAATLS